MKHGTDVFLHNELHFITNTRIRPIYTVRFCRMQPPYYTLTTRFRPRLSYGFKHVLKSYDFFSCRKRVVRRLHATKSYRVNRPLDFFSCRKEVAYDKIARATYPYPCTENGSLFSWKTPAPRVTLYMRSALTLPLIISYFSLPFSGLSFLLGTVGAGPSSFLRDRLWFPWVSQETKFIRASHS